MVKTIVEKEYFLPFPAFILLGLSTINILKIIILLYGTQLSTY